MVQFVKMRGVEYKEEKRNKKIYWYSIFLFSHTKKTIILNNLCSKTFWAHSPLTFHNWAGPFFIFPPPPSLARHISQLVVRIWSEHSAIQIFALFVYYAIIYWIIIKLCRVRIHFCFLFAVVMIYCNFMIVWQLAFPKDRYFDILSWLQKI